MLPLVVVAVLWSFVYNADFGLINAALGGVGLQGFQRVWLGDTSTALLAISFVSGWVFAGFYMIIFYAASDRSRAKCSRRRAWTERENGPCSGGSRCR